jgi:acyl-[acyl-carrier-protein] desaturase
VGRHVRALGVVLPSVLTCALFGVSAPNLVNQIVPLSDLWPGHEVDRLHASLIDLPVASALAVLRDELQHRLRLAAPVPTLEGAAARLLAARRGSLAIDTVAAHYGISRQRFARRFQDATGVSPKLFARIALDENLHMLFYRNVIDAAFDLQPDATMSAVLASVRDFAMPGHGIEGFGRKAVEIAVAGIYDLRQHREEVVMPILRKWRVFERTDFGAEGEQAREELAALMSNMDVQANRFEEKRDALKARIDARS